MSAVFRFLTNLKAAFSKNLRPDSNDFYLERLARWDLTDDQWSKALSKIVADAEKWPSLNQIFPYLIAAQRGTKDEIVPIFRTWRDKDGRPWAQPTERLCSVTPSERDLEQWKREAVPVPAEMRTVLEFAAWSSGRGLPKKHETRRIYTHQEILSGAWHAERDATSAKVRAELADYDDSPEAIGAILGREGM